MRESSLVAACLCIIWVKDSNLKKILYRRTNQTAIFNKKQLSNLKKMHKLQISLEIRNLILHFNLKICFNRRNVKQK